MGNFGSAMCFEVSLDFIFVCGTHKLFEILVFFASVDKTVSLFRFKPCCLGTDVNEKLFFSRVVFFGNVNSCPSRSFGFLDRVKYADSTSFLRFGFDCCGVLESEFDADECLILRNWTETKKEFYVRTFVCVICCYLSKYQQLSHSPLEYFESLCALLYPKLTAGSIL